MIGATEPPASRILSRVVLTGFMGAGKTTVGMLLAERLGWDFADSDLLVEARAGMPVAEIFARNGEPAFRQMETAAIEDSIRGERLVLALGGGAVETASTREALSQSRGTLIVFLDAPLENLVARCAAQANAPARPVLADRERLEQRWRKRLPWYRQAHVTVDTTNVDPEAVVERILSQTGAELREAWESRSGAAGGDQNKPGARA
jgi:shikimate kinase